jgi:glycosyltransferase involved in cell wall biosynthesis
VHEVAAAEVAASSFDVVLYQSRPAWEADRWRLLSEAQRRLPALYIEHDPPQLHPTDQRHWVDDPAVLLVHVTPFNALMWDNGATPTIVIEHGVKLLGVAPDPASRDCVARGVAVVNNLDLRGRRLGLDVFLQAAAAVPLDLIGMGAQRLGPWREVPNHELPRTIAIYRFFFNPIRYTSLGLAVVEAMMLGLPIVGLATTELVTVIRNGEQGLLDTRISSLIEAMQRLLREPALAREMGARARLLAQQRFGIERFVDDWCRALDAVTA